MSNLLTVRRVKVQDIDESGNEIGEASYGVMAADSYAQAYKDTYESVEELNDAIEGAKSILAIADPDGTLFDTADHDKIGRDNFSGKEWQVQ